MKVVVLNEKRINYDGKIDLNEIAQDVVLYDNSKEEDIVARAEGCDAIITKEIKVSKETIEKLPKSVKVICEAGTGYDNIDLESAKKRNIVVMNVPEYATTSVAEFVMGYILALSKTGYIEEISGKTLGIIGTGKIGLEVAKYAKVFNMNIIAYSRSIKDTGIKYVSLENLLKESDYISVHLPLTESTNHLLDEEKLKLIKKGACLINTSRGKVIKEDILIKLLEDKILKGAALDVYENEPLSKDSPLRKMKNVILSPHICWGSIEARKRLVECLKNNLASYENGNQINVVN